MDSKGAITKFLKWRYKYFTQNQFRNIACAVIGLLTGLAAVALKNLTHLIQEILEGKFISEIHNALYFVFPVIGLLLVFLVKKFLIKKPLEPGIPSTLFAISKLKSIMPGYQMWSSLITAPLTVGFGGSVGLEGPTVATGAAIGSNFGRALHLNQATRTLLIGAAAAGAMSSIFKAPIAAIVFAVEIFSLDLTLASMTPLILASLMAVLTSYFFFGDDVLFHFQLLDRFEFQDVFFLFLFGLVTAMISIHFSKVSHFTDQAFKRIKNPFHRLLFGGIFLGVIMFFIPPLFGEGYEVINNLLVDNYEGVLKYNYLNIPTDNILLILLLLAGLALFKVLATSVTLSAGGVGGVFAPTLFTGSLTGYVFAKAINYSDLFEHQLSHSNFALLGMAGLISGVLHAPLTAIFLIAEITGGYELFIPLMIVSLISFLISKKIIPFNIYAFQLAQRGELITHDKDKTVLALMDFDKIIEDNFIPLTTEMKFGELLKNCVVHSNRNIFPVVDKENNFLGIVLLDTLRPNMFNEELYETTTVEDFMQDAPEIIDYESDNMNTVMKKFQDSGAWNLPVLKAGKYAGFISKSKLLTAYRRKLIQVTS